MSKASDHLLSLSTAFMATGITAGLASFPVSYQFGLKSAIAMLTAGATSTILGLFGSTISCCADAICCEKPLKPIRAKYTTGVIGIFTSAAIMASIATHNLDLSFKDAFDLAMGKDTNNKALVSSQSPTPAAPVTLAQLQPAPPTL